MWSASRVFILLKPTSNLQLIRTTIRKKRSQLTKKYIERSSDIIIKKILRTKIFKQSKNIGFYLATNNEVDLKELIFAANIQKKNCYLPIAHSGKKNILIFIKYCCGDILIKNKWGIFEPIYNKSKTIEISALDLVIVPLVAFNNKNYRLGMGKGFYDQTFAHKIKNPEAKPFLLGVAYDFQYTKFEPNKWDVPMQKIITN